MSRFRRTELFLAVAFIGIVWVSTQSEFGGSRFTTIETMSFSSDNSRILVTKLAARDANVPMKGYKMNLSRTVSWLETSRGKCTEVVREDYEPGNQGPAFQFWYRGRTSVACDPANDHIAMSQFGGGDVLQNIETGHPIVFHANDPPVNNLSFSPSGRLLAASGWRQVTVLRAQSDTVQMQFMTDDNFPFIDASLVTFTADESRLVIATWSSVSVWDINTSTEIGTVCKDERSRIRAIAVPPDDSVIVCTIDGTRRFDLSGDVIATLSDTTHQTCAMSSDGKFLAAISDEAVVIYDLASNRKRRTIDFKGARSIALSSNGEKLAVGDYEGDVALVDISTGATHWIVRPPARYRWPVLLPTICLGVWGFVTWRILNRKSRHAETSATTSGSPTDG